MRKNNKTEQAVEVYKKFLESGEVQLRKWYRTLDPKPEVSDVICDRIRVIHKRRPDLYEEMLKGNLSWSDAYNKVRVPKKPKGPEITPSEWIGRDQDRFTQIKILLEGTTISDPSSIKKLWGLLDDISLVLKIISCLNKKLPEGKTFKDIEYKEKNK